MDITQLNDNDLRIFIDSIPEKNLRDPFIKVPKLTKKIKGFRPQSKPLNLLKGDIFNICRHEKDIDLIKVYSNFYNDYKNEINQNIDKLMGEGYEKLDAVAISIEKGVTEKFTPVFLTLEEYTDEEKYYIENKIKKNKEFSLTLEKKTKELVQPMKSQIDNEEKQILKIQENVNTLSEINNKLENKVEKLNKELEKKDLIIIKLEERIKELELELQKIINSSNKELSSEMKKTKDELVKLKQELKDDVIFEVSKLKNSISVNSQNIKELKNNVASLEFEVFEFTNDDFDEMDDVSYLKCDIGDVIEELLPKNAFSLMQEFLVECLYSNKPIIVDRKNSLKLAEVISSIITGGNFTKLDVSSNKLDIDNLKIKIKDIQSKNDSSVILVSGFIGRYDYQILLNGLENNSRHKVLFEIDYKKEFRFMPIEIISDFICFIYDFNSKEIKYKYKYLLGERKTIINSSFNKAVKEIGFVIDSFDLYNVKFEGYLSFSFIPFIVIHENLDNDETVNKISDSTIRRTCEVVFNA